MKIFLFLINTKTDGSDKNDSENNLGSRQRQFQRRQQAGQRKRIRSGVKNIEEIHNKNFKIKQLIVIPKNVLVKKNGQVV